MVLKITYYATIYTTNSNFILFLLHAATSNNFSYDLLQHTKNYTLIKPIPNSAAAENSQITSILTIGRMHRTGRSHTSNPNLKSKQKSHLKLGMLNDN